MEVHTTEWMALGRCRSMATSVFFPSSGSAIELPLKICQTCAVREPCLEYALANRIPHGVWGGTGARERERILRQRRARARREALPTR